MSARGVGDGRWPRRDDRAQTSGNGRGGFKTLPYAFWPFLRQRNVGCLHGMDPGSPSATSLGCPGKRKSGLWLVVCSLWLASQRQLAGCGGGLLKNGTKQAEGGLVGFDKNGVSYVSLPTSHTQHYVSPAKGTKCPRAGAYTAPRSHGQVAAK